MKKFTLKYISVIAFLIALIFIGCNKKVESKIEVSNNEVKSEVHSENNLKEVELNEAQFEASEIVLGTFTAKNLSEVINANGYTKLPPQNQADVSVFVSGIVKSIAIIEGQAVKKGQLVATIESPEFTRMQEQYLTSKSNLEFLKLEYERQQILSEEEVSAKKVFQKTKSEYEIEKARFNSLRRQLTTLNINTSATPSSTVPVLAPMSGYITEVNIKIGSNVEAGKSLLNIVDNSQLHVDLLVYEKDLHKVKTGQNVRFVLTNQDNSEIIGKIFSVGKAFENETKSVAVHADISNEKQQLIPGMYVNALIDVGDSKVNALPLEAIVKADGRAFIFVLEGIHKESAAHDHDKAEQKSKAYHFQRIEVKTGTSQLGFVQTTVLQQIAPDAKIVLNGAYYIQSHLAKSEGGGGHAH